MKVERLLNALEKQGWKATSTKTDKGEVYECVGPQSTCTWIDQGGQAKEVRVSLNGVKYIKYVQAACCKTITEVIEQMVDY